MYLTIFVSSFFPVNTHHGENGEMQRSSKLKSCFLREMKSHAAVAEITL